MWKENVEEIMENAVEISSLSDNGWIGSLGRTEDLVGKINELYSGNADIKGPIKHPSRK